jgi:hypothetical protein
VIDGLSLFVLAKRCSKSAFFDALLSRGVIIFRLIIDVLNCAVLWQQSLTPLQSFFIFIDLPPVALKSFYIIP